MDVCAIADYSRKADRWCTRHTWRRRHAIGRGRGVQDGITRSGELAETGEVRPGARSYERVRANDIERVNLGRKESGAGYGKQQGPTYDCNSVYAGLLVLSYKYYSLAHASHGNC